MANEYVEGGDNVLIVISSYPEDVGKIGKVELRKKGGFLTIILKDKYYYGSVKYHQSQIEKITPESHPELFI